MGKPSFKLRPLSSPALLRFYGLAGALAPGLALAAPTGGAVVGGQASIGMPGAGNTVVNQTSQNAIINWQQFSVGGNEFVLFNQPSASAAVLNRVVGGLPSEILGNISANGRVFIVNPQGVMFGAGSRVDVGGLVTSTLNIRDQDFMAGRHVFAQGEAAPGSIRNEGRISAGPAGFVVLAADRVENAGLISAPGGEVLLAAGSKMTLTLDAEGLVGYSIDAAALSDRAGIENIGEIVAGGGTVVLDAKVARSLMGNVINQRGRISARSVEERDGVIYLSAEGGDIENSGTLDASGTGNADGGRIVVHSDQDVRLTETGLIRADGAGTGNGGMIRLVAEQQLETAEGSVVSATAGPAGQLGGFVELSGHGGLKIRGQVDVGRRGQVLIDPLLLTIADGSAGSVGSTSSGTSATVYERTIEGLLQSGADVALVADNRITLATLSDGELDGRNGNGTGGGLLLGIGTVSGPTTNGVFVDGPPAVGYTFNPGPGGSSYGGIFFQTLGNAIRVDGRLRVSGGYNQGDIQVGDLEGNDIDVSGAGDIELGDVTLSGTGGSVVISNTGGSGSSQDIVIGSLAAAGASLVDIDARNNVQILGNLQADAALVEISSGFDGSGQITASGISGDQVRLQSSGGDISIGGVIAANGGFRSGGDIDVDAGGGSVTLNGVSLDGRGQADISASNNARLLGSYDLGADDGELRVYADSVILGAALPAVGIDVTGGLDITADTVTAYGLAGDDAVNATGDVSIRAGTVEFTANLTAGGEVNIDVDADALNLQDVRGSRARLAAAGFDITVGTISAVGGGSSGLLDVEVSGTETSRVQVGGIVLDTDGYALVSGASGIDGLDSASFTVGTEGTLELRTLSSLDLGSVFGVDGSLVGSGASVTGNVVDVGGDLTLTATDGVDLNAAVTAGGLATIVAGDNSSLSLASLEADGIVLYGGNNTSISAGTLTANGGFRSSGDINVDAFGSYGGVAIGSIELNTAGRVDVTGAAGLSLRDGADVGAGGSLNLRADGGVLQFGSSASSPLSIVGNLYGTANNGARIETYQDIAVSSGDATLNANGTGASISLFGVLGAEDGRIEIDATGPISIAGLAAGSSIQVDATGSSGSISLGAIGLAVPGDVRVAGANGVTLLGDIDAGIGGSIYVSASGGALSVGSDGAPAGSTMAFTGNLGLETTNGADVRAWQDIEVTGGDLVIDADADLEVANLTASDGAVRLTAGGDISTGDITADGGFAFSDGVRIVAEGADPLVNLGSITLLDAGVVYLSGASGVTITQMIDAGGPTGTIEVQASSGTLSLGTASGAVDFVGNLAAYADSGAGIFANIGAAQDVELQVRTDGVAIGGLEAVSITADGNITLGNTYGGTAVRGDIVIGTLDAGGNVSVTSSRDVDASGTITAVGLVDIDAGAGIGGTGVATLGDVSGNRVYIEADGGVSTGLLTAVGISSGSGDFNVYVASAETVSVSGITLTGGNTGRAYLQGDNGITLDGTNFSLGSDGTLKLSAATSGLDFGTNFSLIGNLEANAGEIDGGAMTATGDITLKSPGDIDLTGFISAGGVLEVDGQGGTGVINLQGAYGDRVYIVNDGDITIGGTVSANGGGSASSHDLDVLANGGTLSVGGVAVADPGYAYLGGDDINLTPGGVFAVGYGGLLKIIASDRISFGTGSLESVSITGRLYASAQDIVGNRILTSGSMTLEVGNQLQVNNASGLLRADTGDIVINGDSDGAVVTIGTASADRILITNRGSISTGNLTANGGGSVGNRDIHLQALDDGTGMGVATISVGTIALAATPAEGYVELYAQDGVVLSGGADVGASGTLKVTSERGVVNLGDIAQGGSLEVVNYQGDILGDDLTADTVYLYNAGGAATANVGFNTINTTGNVDIQARDGISASGDVVSTGGIVALEAGGQIDVDGAITAATDITLSAGTGVTVDGLVSGANAGFAIVDVYSNDGDIALTGGAIAANGALRIGDIVGGAVDSITTGALSARGVSVLALSTGASITVNGNIGTDGDIQILAGGALDLKSSTTSANGFVFLRGQTVDTKALSAGTYVDAQAADGLTVAGGVVASSGIDLGGGGVSVSGLIDGGGGDVDIGTLGSGAIQLASVSGGDLHIGDGALGGSASSITVSGSLASTGDVEVVGGVADVDIASFAAVSGDIKVESGGTLVIGGDITSTAGGLSLTAGQGSLALANIDVAGTAEIQVQDGALDIDSLSAGSATLQTIDNGSITTGALTTTSGDLHVDAVLGQPAATSSSVTINDVIQSAGLVSLTAGPAPGASITATDITAGTSIDLGNASVEPTVAISVGDLTAGTTVFAKTDGASLQVGRVEAGGDIGLYAFNDTLTVGGDVISTGGAVTLQADTDLVLAGLTAGGGALYVQADNGFVSAEAVSASGSIFIQSGTGDVTADSLDGDGGITVNATNGQLTINGAVTGSGGSIALNGGDGVSVSGTLSGANDAFESINVRSSGLVELQDVTATGGSVDIESSGGNLSAGAVSGVSGIRLSAAGTLVYSGNLTASNGGIAVYAGAGDLLLSDLTAGGGAVDVQADNGFVTVEDVSASASIRLQSGSSDVTATSLDGDGGVIVNAYNGDIAVTGPVTADGGSISLNSGGSLTVGGDINGANDSFESITVRSGGAVGLQNVTASGGLVDIESSGDDVSVLAVSGVSGIRLSAAGTLSYSGNLTSSNGGVAIYAGAGDLLLTDLTAGGGAVDVQADNGSVTVENVSASASIRLQSGTGDVAATSLDGDGGVIINAYSGEIIVTGPVTADGGSISLNSGGNLTVGGDISGANDSFESITVRSGGVVDLQNVTASGGSVDIESSSDDVSVLAVSGVSGIRLSADGTLAYSGNLTASNGGIALYAGAGDLLLADLTAGGAVTVQADNGSVTVEDVSAGAAIQLQSGTGDVTAASLDGDGGITVDAYAGQLVVNGAVTASGGSISLNGGNGVEVMGDISGANDAFESIDIRSGNGAIELQDVTATGGSIVIDNSLGGMAAPIAVGAVTAAGNVDIASIDSVTLDGAVSGAVVNIIAATLGSATAVDVSATGGQVYIDANIQAPVIDIEAASFVTVTGSIDAGATGSVTLVANNGDVSSGAITTSDLTLAANTIDFGDLDLNGDLSLTSNVGDITTGALTATGIMLDSAADIVLGGAVSGDSIFMSAGDISGVIDMAAAAGNLELNVSTVTAGSIDLSGRDGITVSGQLQAAGGSVSLLASNGLLQVGGITAANLNATALSIDVSDLFGAADASLSGDVSLAATAGDITGGDLSAGGSMTLSASDAIDTGDISGSSILLTAASIDAGAITASGDVSATASAGDITAAAVTGANVTLTATAGTLDSGAITASAALVADAQDIILRGAVTGASVDMQAANQLAATGLLDVMATAGTLRLEAASLGGNGADLSATGAVTLVGNLGAATGAVSIVGNGITADDISGGSLLLTGGTGVVDTDNLTATAGAITVTGGSIDAGVVSATGDVTATASSGALKTSTVGGNVITLTANSGALTTGAIAGAGAVTVGAHSISLGGAVQGSSVDLDAANTLSATGLLDVTATAGTLRLEGASLGGNGADLSATGLVTLVGNLNAGTSSVTISGSGITADDISGGSLLLTGGSGLVDTDKLTATAGAITVTGGSIDAGIVSATGDVTATASSGVLSTAIVGGNAITLTANSGALTTGAITGTGAVTADAQSISLGGAVQGSSVDLDAANALSATGLLDVTATAGALRLEAASLGGSGADLSATGLVTLVGNIGAGTGAVSIVGNGIAADDIGGGSLLLMGGAGLVDTDNLTATAGAVTVTGGSIDAGLVSATGNVTATASSGALKTSTINGGGITLTANSGALTTGAITGAGAVTADAQSILLGGAVQGSSVDLDAANALAATGLLDVTATAGTLRLEGSSLGGSGADLSAAGGVTLVGNLAAGTGAVSIVGNGITADDISGSSLLLTGGTGLADTDNLTASAGAITVTGGGIDAGMVSATGNVTATAGSGALKTSTIDGGTITLTANSGALTTGAITGAGAVTADAQSISLGGAVQGSSVDLDAANVFAATGLLDVTATAGALRLEGASLIGNGADLSATGAVTLVGNLGAGTGAVVISGNGITANDISGSSLQLTGGAGLVDTDDLTATTGAITVTGGSIDAGIVSATGNVTATASNGALKTSTVGGNAITLTANSGALTTGAITGTGAVTADAQSISLGGAVQGSSVDLDAVNSLAAIGLLDVTATAGSLRLEGASLAGSGADLSATGAVTLVGNLGAGSGAVSIVGSGITAADISGSSLLLTGGTGVVDAGSLTATAGAITVTGGSIDAGVMSATGNVTATASNGALKTSTIGGSAITLTANSGALTTGAITGTGAVTADAQSISLGGAVRGTSVDLDAANALAATDLLDVTATAGTLRLEGASLGGAGADLSASGALILLGDLAGGSALVDLSGATITADAISSGTVKLAASGLLTAGNITAGAGGIAATASGLETGDLTATGGGDIMGTATAGDLLAGAVSGDVVTLLASGDIETAGIVANTLSLTAGGSLTTLNLQAGSGGASLVAASIDAGSITVVGGDLSATAQTGDLEADDILANDVELTAEQGDIAVGDVTASEASFSAPEGAVTVGSVNSAGDVDFDFGTGLDTGALTLAGTLFADLDNTDAVFGDVNAQAVDITVSGGDIVIGNVTVTQDIDLTASGSVQFGNLNGQDISISLGQDSTIGSSQVVASGSFALDGAGVLGGNALTVQAQGIDIGAGLALESASFTTPGSASFSGALFEVQTLTVNAASIGIDNATLEAGEATLNSGGNVTLANAQLTGGRYTITATGLVQDAGEGGSTFDVTALGISASEIALGDSIIQVGNGVATIGGDASLLAALQGKNPELLPASQGPNASFIASRVELGSLELAGDYLYISANELQFNGSIEAPVDLFVHFSPMTASADLGIETAAAMAREINLNRNEHFNVFPGTTFAIGGIGFGGDIYVGENGPVTLSPRQSNFVFMTEGSIFGLSNLATNGSVVVLGGTAVSSTEIEVPLSDEFKPDLPGDELKIDSTEDKASGFAAGEVEYESAPEEGDDSLQCT